GGPTPQPEEPAGPGAPVLAVSSNLATTEFTLDDLAVVEVVLANTGTAPAAQVHAALAVPDGYDLTVLPSAGVTPVGFAPGATPWTCAAVADGTLCSGPSLAPGASLPLDLRVVLSRDGDAAAPATVDVGLAAWAG